MASSFAMIASPLAVAWRRGLAALGHPAAAARANRLLLLRLLPTAAALLLTLGLTGVRVQEQGTVFPVTECAVKYKAAARYDDVLTIEVWLTELSDDQLRDAIALRPDALED